MNFSIVIYGLVFVFLLVLFLYFFHFYNHLIMKTRFAFLFYIVGSMDIFILRVLIVELPMVEGLVKTVVGHIMDALTLGLLFFLSYYQQKLLREEGGGKKKQGQVFPCDKSEGEKGDEKRGQIYFREKI